MNICIYINQINEIQCFSKRIKFNVITVIQNLSFQNRFGLDTQIKAKEKC